RHEFISFSKHQQVPVQSQTVQIIEARERLLLAAANRLGHFAQSGVFPLSLLHWHIQAERQAHRARVHPTAIIDGLFSPVNHLLSPDTCASVCTLLRYAARTDST